MAKTQTEHVLNLVRREGVLRSRDLDAAGIPRTYLRRLHAAGLLDNPGRGLYVLSNAKLSEHQQLKEVSKRVPHAVVCLISALQFHSLTTQIAHEIWLAMHESARRPKIDYPPVRIVRFSPAALAYGIEEHKLDGVCVRVTNPAKTVADCFKYRNKIGLDVALEALRECHRERRATVDELFRAAEVCRVSRVIRPYLEALV